VVTKLWAFDVISKFLSWFESFSNACCFCETWTSLTFHSGSQSASCIYIYRQSSQFFQKCCYQIDFLISKYEAQQIDRISSAWILVCFQNFAVNFPAACNWSALHCFFLHSVFTLSCSIYFSFHRFRDEDAPAQIPDPDAEMPDGWLEDEPLYVDDPDAAKPEDWDDEMDGEWEAPKVNIAYFFDSGLLMPCHAKAEEVVFWNRTSCGGLH